MGCKRISAGRLACGVVMGAVALTPLAVKAQDATSTTTTTTSMSSTMQPTQVTGTVLRYYVDRSGYVTAMDVQTANGVQMVRFSPGMGQRIYSTYPVGGNASLYVVGTPFGGATRYDVVGLGDTMPAAGFMTPYLVNDVDLLKAEPYILAGTQPVQFTAKLRSYITDDNGEVLGLVLRDPSMEMGTTMPVGGDILVRVPREVRHVNPGAVGSVRVTPLFPGSDVEVVGHPEAPRFGVVSRYGQRIAATALVVNGHAVGAIGIPRMNQEEMKTLINVDIGGAKSDEERNAASMGYTTYDPNTMMMAPGMSGGSSANPSTNPAPGAMGTN